MKLSNFLDNEDIIGEILMGKRPQQYQPCLKYIYDCVITYRKLDTLYCNNNAYRDRKYIKLCYDMQLFNMTYKDLSKIGSLIKKLPELDSPLPEFRAALQTSGETDTSTTEQTDFFSGPLKSKITTGVTAGFTPALGSFSSQNRGAQASILLDDGKNEMLYYSPDSWNMESDNTEYNIGYHSMEDY
ncbi:hypothetical protein PCYB_006170 [Plasmodium cynomolgi strain B]|uniref:Uncharacterized protein n=1 Tax=Plasmodium cynomolgi (strain B) TaxID=1120755 RepID=K6UNW6_PLACD|nr:hypothetical protein PCYB_006170 [Plasmodium cynomolgi strain B]GAB69868.1 hypothetical protein PCYB_006170 [Plasmodium cynomolgi strain B]